MTTTPTTAAAAAGKSTHASVGDATRALTLPQLPYADAIAAELDAVDLRPSVIEAGIRTERPSHPELYVRLVWLPRCPRLTGTICDDGLTIAWSHVVGWSATTATAADLLDVDVLAAPELVVDAARHYAVRYDRLGRRPWLPPLNGRWEHASALDIALAEFESREVVL